MDEFVTVRIKSGKTVTVPKEAWDKKDKAAMYQYAMATRQATPYELTGDPSLRTTAAGPFDAAMISAGKTVNDIGSNLKQSYAEVVGNDADAAREKDKQADANWRTSNVSSDFPVSSFVGSSLPYFAVPGGKAAQVGAGVLEGAISGDSISDRVKRASLGGGAALVGAKIGDKVGARFQNRVQSSMGNPNATARRSLMDAGIPLTLSQRTDGLSKPLARFFERGRFVWTGSQPMSGQQQARLTGLITEALGIKAPKLTREALGKAVSQNQAVFRDATNRITGKIVPDADLLQAAGDALTEFSRVGSDSPQVERVFNAFVDAVTSPGGVDPDVYLRLRSNLSAATTKSDIETSAIVQAIDAMDEQISRLVPDLADDLRVARDRFRLLMAVRGGAALSPGGDINVASLTKNLEKVFNNFDANVPLPRQLGQAGEAVANYNQVIDPFRSSGTAENAMAAGIPGMGANIDPSAFARFLAGSAAPFAGGGAGALLGGGLSRSITSGLLGVSPLDPYAKLD